MNRRAVFGFLFVILTFVASPSGAGLPSPMSFMIENPDPSELAGHRNSIAIDAAGAPHIAYTAPTGCCVSELRYASREGANWVWETVSTEVCISADLALDASGEPWIAFENSLAGSFSNQIKVAHRSAGAWTIDTIGGGLDSHINNAAIAFDPSGVPHVAWGNSTRGFRIWYATWDGSGWSSELVHQASAPADQDFDLAFDAQGTPHIVVPTLDGTLHAVFVSPSWIKEVMPFRFMPSLALDSSGQPHLASIRIDSALPMILEHQWRGSDGVWHQEDLATLSGALFPPGPSLQLDPNDQPVIAITEGATNTEGGTLRLMRRPADEWITEEIDAGGAGLYPSLALVQGALPRISYSIAATGLHYAAGEAASEVLAARAFLAGGTRTVAIAGPSQGGVCVQLEPMADAFTAYDLVPSSIVMHSDGTGSVSQISAHPGKVAVLGDRNGNGVVELSACFARADLAGLFSSLEGRTTVSVTIEGSLQNGTRVSAPLELTVLIPRGLAARIYPNPLNPAGRLSLMLQRSGPLRVTLFDVSGRMVRVIADESHAEAGHREIAFDGVDSRGVALATGIYFFRIESAGRVIKGRIAVAK
jgi:hypothetical protein